MSGRFQVVIASANPHKTLELEALVAAALGTAVEILPRPSNVPDIEETGETLEDNARLKARAISDATGLPALADDTGLEVVALGGAPGVYSARYAGESASYADNVEKLLGALIGVADRRARFRSVCLVAFPDGSELLAEGEVEGSIGERAVGDGGFGYDPVFCPGGLGGRSFAELSTEEKDACSHRGAAIRGLCELLRERLLFG